MPISYHIDRGLHAVEILAYNFKDYNWHLPNLICDEVLDTIYKHVDLFKIRFYEVNGLLEYSWPRNLGQNDVFYSIDYFGKEYLPIFSINEEPFVLIRDGVMSPFPVSELKFNHIWFNSYKKMDRAFLVGGRLLSNFALMGAFGSPQPFNFTFWELKKRRDNFNTLQEHLSWQRLPFRPDFPTLFPILLKNRDEILSKLDVKLPGMWKNKYKLKHHYYDQLAFIPVDSRFEKDYLIDLANRIKDLVKKG